MEKRRLNGYSVIKSNIIAALLEQTVTPNNMLDRMLLSRYTNRLAYILSSIPHDDYDPLTPDTHLEPCQALVFVFENDHFLMTLRNPLGGKLPEYKFKYTPTISAVLESLETRIITPSLLRLIEKMRFNGWQEGAILALIEDKRYARQNAKPITLKLKVSSEVMEFDTNRTMGDRSPEEQIEYERQTLLIKHPVICTDPDPCVARFAAAMDWRSKMWNSPLQNAKQKKKAKKIARTTGQKPLAPRITPDMISSPRNVSFKRPDLGLLLLNIEEHFTPK